MRIKVFAVSLFVMMLGSPLLLGQDIFSNGSIITDPGAGFNGSDVSQASSTINTQGFAVSQQGPNVFRLADNFAVPFGGWNVTGITFLALIPGGVGGYSFPPTSPFTSIDLNILDGSPLGTPNVVASSNTLGTNTWTGVYRTFNGILINDERPVFGVQATFPNIFLNQGNYWIDVQLTGVTPPGGSNNNAFGPPLMSPGPVTLTGDALQSSNGTWATITVNIPGGTQGVELGFTVQGSIVVPEPTTWALIGLGVAGGSVGVFGWRRRQRKDLNAVIVKED